eukprot:390933_1
MAQAVKEDNQFSAEKFPIKQFKKYANDLKSILELEDSVSLEQYVKDSGEKLMSDSNHFKVFVTVAMHFESRETKDDAEIEKDMKAIVKKIPSIKAILTKKGTFDIFWNCYKT